MFFNTHLILFRMGKLRLSVHRKNEMRKKYGFYPVRIPLNKGISVLKVSVPLDILSFEVSLPLSAYLESPARCLPTLQSRIAAAQILPQGLYFTFTVNVTVCIHNTVQNFNIIIIQQYMYFILIYIAYMTVNI